MGFRGEEVRCPGAGRIGLVEPDGDRGRVVRRFDGPGVRRSRDGAGAGVAVWEGRWCACEFWEEVVNKMGYRGISL